MQPKGDKEMSDYDKLALAQSRQKIMTRLDMHRVPFDCKRCRYEIRCASLAPSRPVVCELSDEDTGLPLMSERDGDGESRENYAEENAEFYLQVHVLSA